MAGISPHPKLSENVMKQKHLFFDAEEYWQGKLYRIWVVRLEGRNRKTRKKDSMVFNITAKTPERAVSAAKKHCALLVGKVDGTARLATPPDLGIRWTPAQ